MKGRTPKSDRRQPVAWTRMHKDGRVFYTSLGGVGDFESGAFCRMIANALFWTANRTPAFKTRHGLPESPEKRDGVLHLTMRTRAEDAPNGAPGETVTRDWPVAETAVILCDMWDKHWCDFASERVDAMAPKVNDLVKQARGAGVQIIHCPSETMGFYQGSVQRWRMQLPRCEPPKLLEVKEPPLPIDDSDGGCPDNQKPYLAWTRQHPAIEIAGEDCIEDNGGNVYSYLEHRRIKNLLYVGVHANMCVLGRSFGIRQMTRLGLNCALVRDLTDTMYNPASPPRVSHDEGTGLVVEHIEKYWCPSLTAADFMAGLPTAGAGK
jgi:nicotinamidase-related amidase